MKRQPLVIKSRAEQIIEARTGEPLEATLQRLYVADGLTQSEVASNLGVTRQAVIRWMEKYGIESRPMAALRDSAA